MQKREWAEWREHPLTQDWRDYLQKELERFVDDTGFDPSSVDATALACAYKTGYIQGIQYALEEPEDLDG